MAKTFLSATFKFAALCAVFLAATLVLPASCAFTASVKIGALRSMDALPLSLGLYKPVFEENKLTVEVVYLDNAAALGAAVSRGELNAAVIDLKEAVRLNDGRERAKIVRVALRGAAGGDLTNQTVVVFNQQCVDGKPAVIRRFLRAYEQSVRELNVRSEKYRPLVMEMLPGNPEASSCPIPLFPFPGEVPTESDIESANSWLVDNKMLAKPVSYQGLVNAGFLWDPYLFRPAACCGW